ncbi:hypothetical protein HQ545_04525 [Candidatus Woesearchaeota archaeon]|nr:hypothetical protein [Candidatus Woesearchaeota archaeon]
MMGTNPGSTERRGKIVQFKLPAADAMGAARAMHKMMKAGAIRKNGAMVHVTRVLLMWSPNLIHKCGHSVGHLYLYVVKILVNFMISGLFK